MANQNGCISAQSSFILTSHGALNSSLNEETSHQRFISVHAHVQHQFCIDRKNIFHVNPSSQRPNTREKSDVQTDSQAVSLCRRQWLPVKSAVRPAKLRPIAHTSHKATRIPIKCP